MAVGAGSIKRASKLNAEAENKKTVAANPEEQTAETVAAETLAAQETVAEEKKAPVKKTTAKKSTGTKTTSTAKKTTTRKTSAKKAEEKAVEEKAVELPAEEKAVGKVVEETAKSSVDAVVVANIDPAVVDVVLGKKENKKGVCRLTEDMPIYLL